MENFVYETPTKVYFGKGEEQKRRKNHCRIYTEESAGSFGGQSARKSGLLDRVEKHWKQKGLIMWNLAV